MSRKTMRARKQYRLSTNKRITKWPPRMVSDTLESASRFDRQISKLCKYLKIGPSIASIETNLFLANLKGKSDGCHWHLVVRAHEDGELSRFAGWLTLTHTQRWHAHRRNAGTGHLYQGRFKSFPVQDEEHFLDTFLFRLESRLPYSSSSMPSSVRKHGVSSRALWLQNFLASKL